MPHRPLQKRYPGQGRVGAEASLKYLVVAFPLRNCEGACLCLCVHEGEEQEAGRQGELVAVCVAVYEER